MTEYMIADDMTYVNLLLNPERYTGYIGPSARRIWEAIYSENCPKRKLHHSKVFLVFSICCFIPLFSKWRIYSYEYLTRVILLASMWWVDTSEESCREEKILYKLVSGLHSSISVHIASDYLLDEATNLVRSAFQIWHIRDICFLSRIRLIQCYPFSCVFQWGQNLTLLYDRVLRYPDRVQNLYFTFLFVLRAVTKVNY